MGTAYCGFSIKKLQFSQGSVVTHLLWDGHFHNGYMHSLVGNITTL